METKTTEPKKVGKRKPGRPKIQAGKRLKNRTEFGLDNVEWAELRAYAEAAGLTPGLMARQWVREKLASLRPPGQITEV